ncbi:MAG: dihydroxy-acid dehydratase [Beijerinckiaceae bacterium]
MECAYLHTIGLTRAQFRRPFAGVVSCWNELAPGKMALMQRALACPSAGARRPQSRADEMAVVPEAAMRGSIALVSNGDISKIATRQGSIELRLSLADVAAREKPSSPGWHEFGAGAFWKYARLIGAAGASAVTRPGGAGETQIHANV